MKKQIDKGNLILVLNYKELETKHFKILIVTPVMKRFNGLCTEVLLKFSCKIYQNKDGGPEKDRFVWKEYVVQAGLSSDN